MQNFDRKPRHTHHKAPTKVRRRKITKEAYCFQKDELISILDNSNKILSLDVKKYLTTLQKEVKDKDILINKAIIKGSKYDKHFKSDAELFKYVEEALDKLLSIIPALKDKVDTVVDDYVCSNATNLNYRLILALTSEIAFLAENTDGVISYLVSQFYKKDKKEKLSEYLGQFVNKSLVFFQLIPELHHADLKAVVDAIGNIPTIKSLKIEDTNDIPTDFIVKDFLMKNFNFKSIWTQVYVKKLLNLLSWNEKKELSHKYKGMSFNFIGNPIYHIRLFLVDLEMLRLERLKNRRKLVELKLLELRNKDASDPKIKKQIEYYEQKLEALDRKINRIMEARLA